MQNEENAAGQASRTKSAPPDVPILLKAATVAVKTAKRDTRELTGDAIRAGFESQTRLTHFLELACGAVEVPVEGLIDNLDEVMQCLENAVGAILAMRNALMREASATNVIRTPADMHKLDESQSQARKAALVDAYEFHRDFDKARQDPQSYL